MPWENEEKSVNNRFKGDLYISATFSIDERINFWHATYYQPDFRDFAQYRISSDTGFEFEFNDRFAFIVTFNLAFDSDPPLYIPDLFYTLKNGIKYNF